MKKLFAVVINSVDKSYQGVQLGHATSVLASKYPENDWHNQTFVWLKSSELKLHKLMTQLESYGLQFSIFREPDIGNKITAIACLTDDYKIFKNFKLF